MIASQPVRALSFAFVMAMGLAFSAVAPSVSSWAQSLPQMRDRCQNEETDPDLAIGACTALIRSGQETERNLPVVYYNRAIAYGQKGEYDRAIEDYTQAIKLRPDYASAYNNRGNAYARQGEDERAMADYNQALRFDPGRASALCNRGLLKQHMGDAAGAKADMDKSRSINPNICK